MRVIRLHMSPFQPPLETVENMVVKLAPPCGRDHVTLQIAPSIVDYTHRREQGGVTVMQEIVTTPTVDTKVLRFDLSGVKKHVVQVQHRGFSIELMQIGSEKRENQDFLWFEFMVNEMHAHSQGKRVDLAATKEGTVEFTLRPPNANWLTDDKTYELKAPQIPGVGVSATKHADRTMEVEISGPFDRTWTFRKPINKFDPDGRLHIAMTWKDDRINFFLHGELVETRSAN